VNVNENLSSLSSALERKLFSETTVWGMSSSLTQVTVVPDFTFNSWGPKVKLPIFDRDLVCGRRHRHPNEHGCNAGNAIRQKFCFGHCV
jgi:hypothetical protein